MRLLRLIVFVNDPKRYQTLLESSLLALLLTASSSCVSSSSSSSSSSTSSSSSSYSSQLTNHLLQKPVPFLVCFIQILCLIDYRLHVASMFTWVSKVFAILTHLSSTHMILGLPFLVGHDFVAFLTLVKFLTHRLAFPVRPTVVGIALISRESNILWQVPHCRQAAFCVIPRQTYVKQNNICIPHYRDVFLSHCLFLAFQTLIAPP